MAVFLFAAALAALPTCVELVDEYDMIIFSTTVASHAKQRPPCHGKRISPSGRRSDPGIRPDGYLIAGMSARQRERQMTSFNFWWRVERSAVVGRDQKWLKNEVEFREI